MAVVKKKNLAKRPIWTDRPTDRPTILELVPGFLFFYRALLVPVLFLLPIGVELPYL